MYLVPRDSGELVVGATQEEMGSDTRVTAGGVWELLRDARAIVPGITELELAEAVAGLRPGTPDNAPVLGPAAMPQHRPEMPQDVPRVRGGDVEGGGVALGRGEEPVCYQPDLVGFELHGFEEAMSLHILITSRMLRS